MLCSQTVEAEFHLLRRPAEFDDPVPVLDGLGVFRELFVGPGPVPVAVEQERLRGDVARLGAMDRGERGDGLAKPLQAFARMPAVADQNAVIAIAPSKVDLMCGYGGEFDSELFLDRQRLAVVLLGIRASARVPQPTAQR